MQCLSQEMTVPDTENHGGTSPIFCTRGKDVGHQFLSHGKGNDRKQSAEDFRHCMRVQSKRHNTIDRLKERGVKKEALDDLSGKDENGPSNRQSNECWTCFKGR